MYWHYIGTGSEGLHFCTFVRDEREVKKQTKQITKESENELGIDLEKLKYHNIFDQIT